MIVANQIDGQPSGFEWNVKHLDQIQELVFSARQPDTVTSGKAVLDSIGQKEYDLVLLDLHMRDSDKYGAMELLRLRRKAHPLVVGTGLADETKAGVHIACLREGMDHYIAKPLILKELALQLKACSILTGKRRSGSDLKVA